MIQTFPSVSSLEKKAYLEQGKCSICGQSAYWGIIDFQMHFCDRHKVELLQKIVDWANNETFFKEHFKDYTKHEEVER